jgi:hypothetical protein
MERLDEERYCCDDDTWFVRRDEGAKAVVVPAILRSASKVD